MPISTCGGSCRTGAEAATTSATVCRPGWITTSRRPDEPDRKAGNARLAATPPGRTAGLPSAHGAALADGALSHAAGGGGLDRRLPGACQPQSRTQTPGEGRLAAGPEPLGLDRARLHRDVDQARLAAGRVRSPDRGWPQLVEPVVNRQAGGAHDAGGLAASGRGASAGVSVPGPTAPRRVAVREGGGMNIPMEFVGLARAFWRKVEADDKACGKVLDQVEAVLTARLRKKPTLRPEHVSGGGRRGPPPPGGSPLGARVPPHPQKRLHLSQFRLTAHL